MPYETRHTPLMQQGEKLVVDRPISRSSFISGRPLPSYMPGDVLVVLKDYGGGKVNVYRESDGEDEMLLSANWACSRLTNPEQGV